MELKQLRLEKGWSQQQLADISGVSSRTIQRLESGENPGMETLKALAAVFEVPFTKLHADFHDPVKAKSKEQSVTNTSPNSTQGLPKIEPNPSVPFVPPKWKGFLLHLLTMMVVVTWLLILSQLFAIDRSFIYLVGYGWAMILAMQALNKASSKKDDTSE
jgi:transcriptional regulator with XRE-family HTH domain